MKKIGIGLIAFLIGQGLVLYKQDKNFQKEVAKESDIFSKCKIFAKKIFGFNKNIIESQKTKLVSIDIEKIKTDFQNIKADLINFIQEFKTELSKGNNESIDILIEKGKLYIANIQKKIVKAKNILSHEYQVLNQNFNLEKDLRILKKLLEPHLKGTQKKVTLKKSSSKVLV